MDDEISNKFSINRVLCSHVFWRVPAVFRAIIQSHPLLLLLPSCSWSALLQQPPPSSSSGLHVSVCSASCKRVPILLLVLSLLLISVGTPLPLSPPLSAPLRLSASFSLCFTVDHKQKVAVIHHSASFSTHHKLNLFSLIAGTHGRVRYGLLL